MNKNNTVPTDKDVEKITELVRDVEIARATYEAKKLELMLFVQQIKNQEVLHTAQQKVAKEAVKVITKNKGTQKRSPMYVPPEKRRDAVIEFLRKHPWSSTSVIQNNVGGMDYQRALHLLETLKEEGKIKCLKGKPFKNSGKMLIPRTWALP